MIYPAVGDIIEEDGEEASAREPLNNWVVKEKERQCDEQQKRENVIVTSGGLIFLAIAALLITASFLMSPVIHTIFRKFLPFSISKSLILIDRWNCCNWIYISSEKHRLLIFDTFQTCQTLPTPPEYHWENWNAFWIWQRQTYVAVSFMILLIFILFTLCKIWNKLILGILKDVKLKNRFIKYYFHNFLNIFKFS